MNWNRVIAPLWMFNAFFTGLFLTWHPSVISKIAFWFNLVAAMIGGAELVSTYVKYHEGCNNDE